MKKVWNISFFAFILCLYGGLLTGCSEEMDDNGNIKEDSEVMVRVQFDTRSSGTATPDLEEINDNESRIESVRLYAFDGDVLDNMVYKDALVDNTTGSVTVDIKVTTGNRTFYAVINEPDVPEIHSALALANHPNGIKLVQYQIAHYLSNDDKIVNILKKVETEDYCLPMYGYLSTVVNSSTTLAMQVDRAVARIDVYMAKAAGITTSATTENATLNVKAPSLKGYIANENVVSTTTGASYSLDSPVNATLNNYSQDSNSGYTKIYSFYVPEQICPETADRLIFTIGGIKWNNTETLYNPFILGNDNNNTDTKPLEKIERNKVYQVFCRMSPSTKDIGLDVLVSPWNAVVPQDSILHPGKLGMTNCYIVNPGRGINIPVMDVYKIWNWQLKKPLQAVKAVKAEVIWEDTQGLIEKVTTLLETEDYSYSKIQVKTANGKSGNAVVGMWIDGDPDKTYRWSWHIWVTDYNPNRDYDVYNSEIIMDRNLGALTNFYEENGYAKGLNYQWGRKDPFPGAKGWTDEDVDLFGVGIEVEDISSDMNLLNSIQKPYVFYTSPDGINDWYTTDENKMNNNLWLTTAGQKTIYDPCPEGWRVPQTTIGWNLLTDTNFPITDFGRSGNGVSLGYFSGGGSRDYFDGSYVIDTRRWHSEYWFADTDLGEVTTFAVDSRMIPQYIPNVTRSSGFSVRCVKE